VRDAAAGDVDAFQVLYRRNVNVVFAFLRNRVGAQAAEDLTAETFVRAYERIGKFQWRGIPIRAWLLRIAYNLIVASARKTPEDPRTNSMVGASPIAGHEEAVIDHLGGTRALDALATLPEAQQVVLQLRVIQEISVAETAIVLGSTEEAVRSQTYRALKALRRALDGA